MGASGDVIGAFNAWAADYDAWYSENPRLASLELAVLKAIELSGRGVEIGGGSGFFSLVHQSIVLEPAWGMAVLAKAKGLDVIVGVGELPPVRDSSLDYALMVVTLCFLKDPLQVMRRAGIMLKPNGLLVACIVPRNGPYGARYIDEGRKGHRFYSLAAFYTVAETMNMMRAAGFIASPKVIASLGPVDGPAAVNPSNAEEFGFACVSAFKQAID